MSKKEYPKWDENPAWVLDVEGEDHEPAHGDRMLRSDGAGVRYFISGASRIITVFPPKGEEDGDGKASFWCNGDSLRYFARHVDATWPLET